VIGIRKPCVRIQYTLEEIGSPTLEGVLAPFLRRGGGGRRRGGKAR
jgi:hypothetical protein